MKKALSIILCVALLSSLFAGLGLRAAAADVKGISFSLAKELICYEGYNSEQESEFIDGQDVFYTVYRIGSRELQEEGNALTVYYDDDTSEVFTYQEVQDPNDEHRYEWKFYSDAGNEFDINRVGIETAQSYDNQWQPGNTYNAYLNYEGKKARFSVRIEANPVKSVSVLYDRPIEMMENTNGQFEYDEQNDVTWFNYWFNSRYFNKANLRLEVTYSDDQVKTFSFHEQDEWTLTTDDGEHINERYLDARLDQWQNHLALGSENTMEILYYGIGQEVPVSIFPYGPIEEGALEADREYRVLTYSNEWHSFTFAPENDGVYRFEDSLVDRIIYDGRFSAALYDGEAIVDSMSNRELVYTLEGGKSYTFRFRNNEEGNLEYERLRVTPAACITAMDFIPANALSVYENDVFDSGLLYHTGNRLAVTFSDGAVLTFVCDDWNNFVTDDENRQDFESVCRDHGVDNIERPYGIPSSEPWAYSETESLTVIAGTGRATVPVTVNRSPFSTIAFTSVNPVLVYEGTAHREGGRNQDGEWVDYNRYDIDRWDLMQEGNAILVTYPDESTERFVCGEYEDEDTHEYHTAFISEIDSSRRIDTDELIIRDEQSPDNEWQAGETYALTLYYKGQSTAVPVTVASNPIKGVAVAIPDGKLTLFENIGGFEEYNDRLDRNFFRYDEDKNYLRAENAVITITFGDDSQSVYRYRDYDWSPTDDDGNAINDRYFGFDFGDQWESPLDPAVDNVAYVSYYGIPCIVPVEIVPAQDVDEGAIAVNELRAVFFRSSESHVFRFTPEHDGYYAFEEGLSWHTADNQGYSYDVMDGETPMQDLSDENDAMLFCLEGGKSYTIRFSHDAAAPGEGMRSEYFRIEERIVLTDFTFTPAETPITVREGEYPGDQDIYRDGNQIELVFSDGVRESFTCNNEGRFVNASGIDIGDFGFQHGLEFDCRPYATGSADVWRADEEETLSVHVGPLQKSFPVVVENSEVEGIRYLPAKPPEILDIELEYRDWENRTEFYGDPFRPGDKLEVTYKDERGVVTYVHVEDNVFRDEAEQLEDIRASFYYNDKAHYDIGDTIAFTVSYQSGKAVLNATVVESDVESISFAPKQIDRLKEYDGRYESFNVYDDDTGTWHLETYFHYNENPQDLLHEGYALTVHYTDGTSATYTCNGEGYFNENGEELDYYYVGLYSDQRFNHWSVGGYNALYITYKGAEFPISVNLIDREDWSLYAYVQAGEQQIADGETLYVEPGKAVFITLVTDDRNMLHGVTPFAGFSDGFDEGTLTTAGFTVRTGPAKAFGFPGGDIFGAEISTGELAIGARGDLQYYLYEMDESIDLGNFDFINTPHALDCVLHVEVSDHRYTSREVKPTCTEQGYTEYTCSICGDSYRKEYVPALGHAFDLKEMNEHTLRTAATESKKATYFYTCSRCGAVSDADYFTNPLGSVKGNLGLTFYKPITLTLYKGDTPVDTFTLQPDQGGNFCFDALEEGVYSIVAAGDGFAGVEIKDIMLAESEDIDFVESADESLHAIAGAIGDINGDGVVDIGDVAAVLADGAYMNTDALGRIEDLNNDGVIDLKDIRIILLAANYGAKTHKIVLQ